MFDNKPMASLSEFIAGSDPSRTDGEWAELLKISRSHFTEIKNGTALPGRKLIMRIDEVTNGKVPPASWFEREDQ